MKIRMLSAVAVCCAGSVFAAGRPDLVAQVKAGELKEAKASWWGFDAADSTEALQEAIRSGVPTLTIDNTGSPWIVRPIFLESNQTILFEDGVVVEAKKGEFKGRNDSLFSISLKENVILRGAGATLRMHRADYDNPELYEKAEWRHTLSIRSSKNVEVHGLTLALSGGDGIYLGVSKRGVPDENIVIKDVVCDRHYRQGISVIAARNLLIENTVMKDTAGTPPAAGIDFEPNHPTEELVNCVMRNCVSENNAGCGYVFYLPNLHADSAPLSIRLENCISRGGNRTDFSVTTGNTAAETVGGHIEVVGCRFAESRGTAIHVRRKPVAGAAIRFEDCVIDTPTTENPGSPPIVIQSQAGCRRTVGGIDFGNLLIIDPVDRPFMAYEDWVGGSGVESLTGTVTVRRDGTETTRTLTREWLQEAFPPRVLKQVPALDLTGVTLVPAAPADAPPAIESGPCFLRKKGELVVYAKAGDTVTLTMAHTQVGKYGGRPLKIAAVSPSGKTVDAGAIPFQETASVSFEAPETGLYRLPVDAGSNRAGVVSSSHPVAVSGVDGPIRFIGIAGDLYFLVPAGTSQVGLLIYGEGAGEAIRATVFDPAGNQVWDKDNITLPEMWSPDLAAPQQDQVWRLRLSRPTGSTYEDNYVDIRGIPPFLARDPSALLEPKQ